MAIHQVHTRISSKRECFSIISVCCLLQNDMATYLSRMSRIRSKSLICPLKPIRQMTHSFLVILSSAQPSQCKWKMKLHREREPKSNENCANSMSAHRIMAGEWLQCRLGLCAVLNSRSRCFCHKYNLSVDECNLHPYDHRSVLSRSRTTQIILGNCASVSEKIYRRIALPAPTRYTLCGEPHDDSKMYEHQIFGFECCVG